MKREIKDFFGWNKGSVSRTMMRDAFQAYMRSILLIAFKAPRERKHGLINEELMDTICHLDNENKQGVSLISTREIQALYQQLKLVDVHNILHSI